MEVVPGAKALATILTLKSRTTSYFIGGGGVRCHTDPTMNTICIFAPDVVRDNLSLDQPSSSRPWVIHWVATSTVSKRVCPAGSSIARTLPDYLYQLPTTQAWGVVIGRGGPSWFVNRVGNGWQD